MTDEKRTWLIDTIRQSTDGIIITLIDSVFIIIAIRYFSVGDFWKGLIASSKFIGFLLSSPLIGLLNRTNISRSRILFLLTIAAAITLTVGTVVQNGMAYAIAVTLCSAAFHLRQPFFTDLYGEIYHHKKRARRISHGAGFNLIVTLCSGLGCGYILDLNLSWWRWINLAAISVLIVSAFLLARLPGTKPSPRSESWLHAMTLPFRDLRFVYVQFCWMFIGFANLCTIPLRAVYLAEPERGLGISPFIATLILVVIPSGFQLIFNRFSATLYHRLSFPAMRIYINLIFAVGVPLCFLTESLPVIIISAMLMGIGLSGSLFLWQLWVTRIVGAGEVRLYQSAHALLSGMRGILAPFIGFAILKEFTFQQIGFISGSMALISSLFVLPLLRKNWVF